MTRTVCLGGPADWQREIYDLVAEAQRAGRQARPAGRDRPSRWTRPPAPSSRRPVTVTVSGTGSATESGLEIHEDPFLGPSRDTVD